LPIASLHSPALLANDLAGIAIGGRFNKKIWTNPLRPVTFAAVL